MKLIKTHYDRTIFVLVFLLAGIGTVMLYSASSQIAADQYDNASFFLQRHLIRFLIGAGFMIFFMKFNYRNLRKLSPAIYISSILMLIVTLGYYWSRQIATPARWLPVGPLSIQTSDVAKFAIVIYLAAYMSQRQEQIRNFKHGLLPAIIMLTLCLALIVAQPDFSTTFSIAVLAFFLLFIGRAKIVHLGAVALTFFLLSVAVISTSPYKMERLKTFLNPTEDVVDSGYQIQQSLISLGNGGLLGMGLGDSYEKNLFLPEPHTDFIYAIIGEELGFVGTVCILTLFLLLYLQILRVSRKAPDLFGMYLTAGLGTAIFLYAVIHAGVVTGLLPTTGLPLPFISYGGSHLIVTMASIGVILNVSSFRKAKRGRRAW